MHNTPSAGILTGLHEPAGLAVAGTINALSYILWSLWLIATGVTLLRRPGVAHHSRHQEASALAPTSAPPSVLTPQDGAPVPSLCR